MANKRILIVAVNWLGDLIFMTPAIRSIRRAYPGSFIACWVPRRGLDLLEGNPHLNAVIPLEAPRGFQGIFRWWPLIRRLKAERFDAAFLFHRSFSRTVAVWAAGIPSRIGYRTWKRGWLLTEAVDPPARDSVHKAVGYLRLVEAVGIKRDGFQYDITIPPGDRQTVETLFAEWGIGLENRLVALHVGANWHLKRWPLNSFAQLADTLATRYGVQVLFLGDSGDLPLVQRILSKMRTKPLVATGRTTFRQLAACLSRVSLLISNDSGPLHLGLAVGTPVVALFGPTDPKLTGPLDGAKAVILFGSIGCPVPCYQLKCPVNLCMSEITVEQVLGAAEQVAGLKGSYP